MSKTTRSARALIVAVLAAGSIMETGCTSPTTRTDTQLASFFNKPAWIKTPWSKSAETPPEPYPNPVKIASTWTPDVLVQSGKAPTRGFGGRLFFFDEKTKTVPVEGTLTVHGFEMDAQGKDKQIKPFKFTPEQFTRHFSNSDFGASYSIWIPWDAAGGEEKRISLVPTFETTEGKVVQGSPTTMLLPGKKQAAAASVATNYLSSQYRGHQDAIAHHTTRPSGLVTTTIRRHTASPDGKSSLPSGSLQERVNAIVASQRNLAPGGATPFADVPLTHPSLAQQTPTVMPPSTMPPSTLPPTVMPASAVMPNQGDNQVRSAGQNVSAPRRIKSPVTGLR